MTRHKTEEYTVEWDPNNHILIEHIVQAYVDDKIGEGARVITFDSDGLVFEWRVEMTAEEEEVFLAGKRAKEEAEAKAEADDRKLGF